jgi:aquaporin NIP
MAMIYAVGDISGAHQNPAVTIGFWSAKRFPSGEVLPYLISQAVGAMLASGIQRFLFVHQNLGATLPAGSDFQSFYS